MAGLYVWKVALTASIGAALSGLIVGSINGMFEMYGFQGTYPELFEHSDDCSLDSNTGKHYSIFENVTAACGICSTTKICGGSNGAEASSILGLMVSITSIGAAFGAFFGGWPSTAIGRRLTLSISGLIMAVGALLSAASFHSWLFIMGRGISGFGMGLSYSLVALYISEISPKKARGKMASIIGPMYGLSILFQFSANCGFSYFCMGWRISLVMQVVAGIGYAGLMFLVPRTPRWLVLHNRNKEAHLVLSRINGSTTIDNSMLTVLELEELKSTISELPSNYFKSLAKQFSITVKWKYFKRLLFCWILLFLKPVIGTFTYYFSSTFFCKLNIDSCTSNILLGFSLLIGGVVMSTLMDKAGRKLILLVGTLLMLLLQALMTALIQVFNLQEEENDGVGYLLTGLFCAYALVYSASWLTIPWVISCEIFPVEARGLNVAVSSTIVYMSAAIVLQITPIIIDSVLGIAGYLCLLIGLTVLCFILVLLGLPETKGVSLERMDEVFDKPWLERVNLAYYSSCGISMFKQPQVLEETNTSIEKENAFPFGNEKF